MSFVPDILTPGQIFIFLLGIGFLGALTIIWRRNGTPRFARKLRHSGETRQVRVNGAHPEFPDNTVANTKYRPLAIFPLKGLFLQLKHNTNRYFLFIAVLQLNTNITPVNPLTTWLPLIFVVAISMTKDLIDDLGRRRADRLANAREYVVCKGASRVPTRASALRVGDVVRLAQDDEVPADCVVLKTSDELGGCYIQTTNLDGESDLKPRRALIETQTMAEEEMGTLNGTINCAHPNAAIYSFDANLTLEASGAKKFSLSTEHLALQCTHVRNTEFVYAAIVYAGEQTKYGCNKRAPPDKIPKAGVFVNRLVIVVFLSQLCLAFLFGGLGMGWYATSGVQLRYLGYNQAAGDSAWSSYVVFPLRFLILISVMIPISLQVNCLPLPPAPPPPPFVPSLHPAPPFLLSSASAPATRHSSCFLPLSRLRFRTPLLFALHRSSPGARTLLPPSPTAPLSPHLAIAPLDSPLTLPPLRPSPTPHTPCPPSQPQPLCAVAGDDRDQSLAVRQVDQPGRPDVRRAFGHAGARSFDDACRGPRSDRVRAHRQDRDPHRE